MYIGTMNTDENSALSASSVFVQVSSPHRSNNTESPDSRRESYDDNDFIVTDDEISLFDLAK
jgi:hypothetical protein